MQAPRELADDQIEKKNWFQSFLESDLGHRTLDCIDNMIKVDSTRCIVNFSDIREYSHATLRDDETNIADRCFSVWGAFSGSNCFSGRNESPMITFLTGLWQ